MDLCVISTRIVSARNGDPQEALELLTAARSLIAEPAAWTPKCWARDAAGTRVFPQEESAVAWCLFGAVFRAGVPYSTETLHLALKSMEPHIQGDPTLFDDKVTHAEVLGVLDRAIQGLSEA